MVDPIKVLVVEDTRIAQKMAKLILSDLGCQVDIAENGQKGLVLTSRCRYQLIFIDISLPDINGVEVAKRIRNQKHHHARQVPIVALTAVYDETYKPICLEAGMNEFILKPLTRENSQIIIHKWVKNS